MRPRRYWNLLDSDVLAWRYEAGPDEGFLEDISEVREIIEPPAASLAAERATVDEVAGILTWCDRWRWPRPTMATTTSTPTWPSTRPFSTPATTICSLS